MIKIFADTSNIKEIEELNDNFLIRGFTTNPTLMRKAGIQDYEEFCKEVLKIVKIKPISFEVFADDFNEMEMQARIINSWGDNIYIKIPITNTKGEKSYELINKLSNAGIRINATAIMTSDQVLELFSAQSSMIASIFAGRIADTGVDPMPIISQCKTYCLYKDIELLWASPREVFNVYQAEKAGADIITLTPELIKKLKMNGYALGDLSLDTVKMFYEDGQKAGYKL